MRPTEFLENRSSATEDSMKVGGGWVKNVRGCLILCEPLEVEDVEEKKARRRCSVRCGQLNFHRLVVCLVVK
jgi:hypothetical protein